MGKPLTQIRSDEVEELISNSPSWIIRWGITIFFLFVILLIALTFIISYPEVIKASVVITSPRPPSKVVALASGQIESLSVVQNEIVRKEQVLAVISSSGRYEDIQVASNLIKKGFLERMEESRNLKLQLGELQDDFNKLQLAFTNHRNFKELKYYPQKIESLRKRIISQKSIIANTKKQLIIAGNELDLIITQLQRDSILLSKKAITLSDFEITRGKFLQQLLQNEKLRSTLLSRELKIQELTEQLRDNSIQYQENKENYYLALENAKKKFASELSIWQNKYVLKAPITGRASLFKVWSDNQFVSLGDEVLTIVPIGKNEIIGKITMPRISSGKVKVGHRVNVKLLGYPYKEFGVISGLIRHISPVPNQSNYLAEIEFPDGLLTSYKKEIQFQEQLEGEAEIITENTKLIERILYHFKDLIVNNSL
ncbi:MAG: HlyD family efflux transporter periplasmic adaptor subunit [Cyclobacteriaceae bacterium]|nr:HlyD family efflux transporter periplasmic adaptor subunit [Cyclobacteriaceae bacterium HetDA_MAG_MS6]